MSGNLKLRQLIFGEQGVVFAIYRFNDNDVVYYNAVELFHNDILLAEFSHADVRLIGYYAAFEEFSLDRKFLNTLKVLNDP